MCYLVAVLRSIIDQAEENSANNDEKPSLITEVYIHLYMCIYICMYEYV
jgi:hypothetical protein